MVINYADFKVRAVEERELKEKKEEEKKDRWHQKAFLEELNLHHFRQAFWLLVTLKWFFGHCYVNNVCFLKILQCPNFENLWGDS